MKKLLPLIFSFIFFTSADVEVSDVNYKDSLVFNQENFVLNGVGVRDKFIFDLYTIGLYVKKKSTSESSFLNTNDNRFVRIVVVSSLITADRFGKGMNDGFEKSTGGNLEPIKNEIALLKKGFGTDFNINDEFFVFFGGNGETKIYKGKDHKMTIPKSKAFQKALLGMWIGENPVVGDLKDELLGKD